MDHAPDPLQQGQAQNPVVLLVFQHVKGGENVLAFELDRAQVGGDVHQFAHDFRGSSTYPYNRVLVRL